MGTEVARRQPIAFHGLVPSACTTSRRPFAGAYPRTYPQVAPEPEGRFNLKSAKALGLEVPPTLLARADEGTQRRAGEIGRAGTSGDVHPGLEARRAVPGDACSLGIKSSRAADLHYFPTTLVSKDGKPLMLAGIWEIAEYKGDSRVAFAILTDEPNELVASGSGCSHQRWNCRYPNRLQRFGTCLVWHHCREYGKSR